MERLLLALHLRSRTIQHLQEVGRFGTHSRVKIDFGAFDVIVKVVSERMNQVDRVVSRLLIRVSWEEHECYVADVVTDARSRQILQLQWGLSERIEHRRRRLRRFSSLAKLLKEHFSENDVIGILEDCTEDYSYSIRFCFDVHGLILSIVYNSSLVPVLSGLLELKVLFEDRREAVSLQRRRLLHQVRRVVGKCIEIVFQCHIETHFWSRTHIRAIDSSEKIICAVLLKFGVESQRDAENDSRPITIRIRQFVEDTVEIGECYVHRVGFITFFSICELLLEKLHNDSVVLLQDDHL